MATLVVPTTPSGEIASLRAALKGQYTIERELGRGGMGIVVLARDERLERLVALKVLPPALAEQPVLRERFLREARMAAQLSHPNIVPVHRADEIGGFAFFAMGFVDGETLADRIRDRGTLTADEVVRVLREVAWALAYAHARGIVHRDVKPENILLERSTGRAIVTDFGIARADFNASLTQDGYVMGTVHYMSPEQSSGLALDGRSDLYALGCVGFLALSGRLPFTDPSPQAIIVAHATKEPPSLRSIAPDVPATLAAVIDQCLRKAPADRFATGEALADALGKALDSVAVRERESNASSATISNDDAMLVWRRAAELQAEAAARLESRMRAGDTRQLVAAESEAPLPVDGYRVRDVEAAAVDAGISQKYVALAIAELKASPAALQHAQPEAEWKERLGVRLLGARERSIAVSRVFRHPPRVVLHALGRSLQSAPWSLTLRDTLGGHPLDGGVLLFDVPPMAESNYRWSYVRYGVFVPQLRVSLSSVAGDSRACEVTIEADLRHSFGTNLGAYLAMSGGGGVVGSVIAAAVAKKAFLMAGAALFGPAFAGAALLGMGVLATAGPMYRWGLRKAVKEMEDALAAVEGSMRAIDIFGDRPRDLGPG